jgi:hypothetical protein
MTWINGGFVPAWHRSNPMGEFLMLQLNPGFQPYNYAKPVGQTSISNTEPLFAAQDPCKTFERTEEIVQELMRGPRYTHHPYGGLQGWALFFRDLAKDRPLITRNLEQYHQQYERDQARPQQLKDELRTLIRADIRQGAKAMSLIAKEMKYEQDSYRTLRLSVLLRQVSEMLKPC